MVEQGKRRSNIAVFYKRALGVPGRKSLIFGWGKFANNCVKASAVDAHVLMVRSASRQGLFLVLHLNIALFALWLSVFEHDDSFSRTESRAA